MKTWMNGLMVAALLMACAPPVRAATVTNKESELPIAGFMNTNDVVRGVTNVGGVPRSVNYSPAGMLEGFKRSHNWPTVVIATNGTTPTVSVVWGTNYWVLPWSGPVAGGILHSNDWRLFNAKAPTNSPVFFGNVTVRGGGVAVESDLAVTNDIFAEGTISAAGSVNVSNYVRAGTALQVNNVQLLAGNGSPEGSITAPPQSLYFQTNQTAGIGLWMKTNGTGNTGWWLLAPGQANGTGGTNLVVVAANWMIASNGVMYGITSLGNTTNGVIDWGSTNAVEWWPSNSFTLSDAGSVSSSLYTYKHLLIFNTNSMAAYFFTNDLNFGTVHLLPAQSTNRFIAHNWGGRKWISSGQQPEIGTNAYMRTRTGVRRTIEVPAPAFGTNATNWSATFVSGGANLGIGPKAYWTFSEDATNEIHFSFTMPQTWDASTLVARFLYATTNAIATQTNVFSIAARTATGQSMDGGTYGTAQIIRTATVANSNLTWTASTPNLVPAGTPAAGAFTEFKVTRLPGHADDNMSGLLRLYSVQLQYIESIVEPAALP